MKKHYLDEQVNNLLFEDLLPSVSKEEFEQLTDHTFSSMHQAKMEAFFSSIEAEVPVEKRLPFYSLIKSGALLILFLVLVFSPRFTSLAMDSTMVTMDTRIETISSHAPINNSITLTFTVQGDPLPEPTLVVHSLPEGSRINREFITPSSHLLDYYHPSGSLLIIEKILPPQEPLVLEGEQIWEDVQPSGHYIFIKDGFFRTIYVFRNNWLYRVTTTESLEFSLEMSKGLE